MLQKTDVIALAVLLVLAAFLRMGQPAVVEYKRDEATLSTLALEMAQGGDIKLLGIDSSVGFPNAPVNVYLLAVPYALSTNPQVATQFVALLNVAAVGLAYAFMRQWVGVLPAFLAALLYAVSPWSVMFSRKIWAQNMLPPFALLTVWAGVAGFVRGKGWGQWVHLPLLVITGQIHYAAVILIPVSLLLVSVGWRRGHLNRALVGSVGLAALLCAPYALGLWRAEGVALPASGGGGLGLTLMPLSRARILLSGVQIHAFAGAERYRDYLATVPTAYPLFDVLTVAFIGSVGWAVWRSVRRPDARTPVDVALVVWVLAPLVLFALTWTEFFIHYLIPMTPAAFMLLGFALHDAIMDHKRLQVAAGGLAALIAVLQVVMVVGLLAFLRTESTVGAFGTPLGDLLEVHDAVLAEEPQGITLHMESFDEQMVWRSLFYGDAPIVGEGDVILATGCEGEGQVIVTRDGCYRVIDVE